MYIVGNKIYIIAGEKSGDKLGSDLMFNLNLINSDFVFCGVGGPLMQAEGLVSIFPMEELTKPKNFKCCTTNTFSNRMDFF